MLYSKIIAVCSQIHTKHTNTLCGQNVEFLCVKNLAAHEVTPGLQKGSTLSQCSDVMWEWWRGWKRGRYKQYNEDILQVILLWSRNQIHGTNAASSTHGALEFCLRHAKYITRNILDLMGRCHGMGLGLLEGYPLGHDAVYSGSTWHAIRLRVDSICIASTTLTMETKRPFKSSINRVYTRFNGGISQYQISRWFVWLRQLQVAGLVYMGHLGFTIRYRIFLYVCSLVQSSALRYF
jgi:hypothetical protein